MGGVKQRGKPLPPGPWVLRAACSDQDPDLFASDYPAGDDAQEAMAVCWSRCPVRAECEKWGVDDPCATGVRGGFVWRDGYRRDEQVCRYCSTSFEQRPGRLAPFCWQCMGIASQFSDSTLREIGVMYRRGDRSPLAELLHAEQLRRQNSGKNERRREQVAS